MKISLFTLLLNIIVVLTGIAQSNNKYFPEDKLITVGTFYFPEQWPESQWERDFKKMAEMGFEYVHMGEFSWAFLEPEEGKYDFKWMDKAVELAARQGLKVMLCTPTATTPVWMGLKYPEVYVMNGNYLRGEHGSRQNNSLANEKFQEFSYKIVEALARHYGSNEHVWGWQLDNEPEAKEDYSPSAQEAFRNWLESKYVSIDKLNEAWGTSFWSLTYTSFDEIRIHNTNAIVWWGNNPHAVLDFKRFTAQTQANFLNRQAEILKQFISPKQFVTTNYAALPGGTDPRLSTSLDFPAFTSYPNGGSANLGKDGFRMGNPDNLLLCNDYYKTISNGVYGVMELQPGQVNWGSPNSLLMPGALRMWLWQCFGSGADFVSSYRFRQVLFGVEQYHSGIMKNDGITPSQGGIEYMQFIKEMRELEKLDLKNDAPNKYQHMKAAILWSHENMWDHSRQPQNRDWNLLGHVQNYQKILRSFGAPVDFIAETDDLSKYSVLVVPAYQSVDSSLVEKWKDFAVNGGDLIITCRTASKTRDGHFWEAGWGAPVYSLIGAEIDSYDMLPGYQRGKIGMDGMQYDWNKWGEQLKPYHPEYIKAIFNDQFYKGTTAVVQRKLGKGTVTYIGVASADGALETKILKELYDARDLSTMAYPEGVFVSWNKGVFVAVNYSSNTHSIELPASANIIFGETQIVPAGVLVWSE